MFLQVLISGLVKLKIGSYSLCLLKSNFSIYGLLINFSSLQDVVAILQFSVVQLYDAHILLNCMVCTTLIFKVFYVSIKCASLIINICISVGIDVLFMIVHHDFQMYR